MTSDQFCVKGLNCIKRLNSKNKQINNINKIKTQIMNDNNTNQIKFICCTIARIINSYN